MKIKLCKAALLQNELLKTHLQMFVLDEVSEIILAGLKQINDSKHIHSKVSF